MLRFSRHCTYIVKIQELIYFNIQVNLLRGLMQEKHIALVYLWKWKCPLFCRSSLSTNIVILVTEINENSGDQGNLKHW